MHAVLPRVGEYQPSAQGVQATLPVPLAYVPAAAGANDVGWDYTSATHPHHNITPPTHLRKGSAGRGQSRQRSVPESGWEKGGRGVTTRDRRSRPAAPFLTGGVRTQTAADAALTTLEVVPRGHSRHAADPAAGAYDPAGHPSHASLPRKAAAKPGSQLLHTELPGSLAAEPGPHAAQPVAPREPWNDPRGQGVQDVAPTAAEKVPRPQGAHAMLAAPLAYVPGLHGCGAESPTMPAEVPGGAGWQTEGDDAPMTVDVVPRGQSAQENEPGNSLKLPATQVVQFSEEVAPAAALNVPAGHSWQSSEDVDRGLGLNVPAGQRVHTALPMGANEPARQGWQDRTSSAPVATLARPAGQGCRGEGQVGCLFKHPSTQPAHP